MFRHVRRPPTLEIVATAAIGIVVGSTVAVGASIGLPALLVAGALAGLIGLVILVVRNVEVASATLLALSFLCMRPMIGGERYSSASIVLAVAAAGSAAVAGLRCRERSSGSVVLWVSLLWLWNGVLSLRPGVSVENTLRGVADVPLVVGAAWVVAADPFRRTLLVKLIIGFVIVTCISLVATIVMWPFGGAQALQIGILPAGYKLGLSGLPLPGVPVLAPFTTTYGSVLLGGSLFPRFLGLGRESGIMAAIIAWTYFMLPRVGWNHLGWKLFLLVGLAATQSTAGFGTFIGVYVITRLIITRTSMPPSIVVIRQIAGAAALVLGGYLAIYAPVVGVQFKLASNAASVNDRLGAISNGFQSAIGHPLGQAGYSGIQANTGINLIGALVITGVPGLIFSLTAFVRPLMLSADRRAALGPVAVLLVTCLTAQPLIDSTAFFLLVMLACSSYSLSSKTSSMREAIPRDVLGSPATVVPRHPGES